MAFSSNVSYSYETIQSFYEQSKMVPSNEFDYTIGMSTSKDSVTIDKPVTMANTASDKNEETTTLDKNEETSGKKEEITVPNKNELLKTTKANTTTNLFDEHLLLSDDECCEINKTIHGDDAETAQINEQIQTKVSHIISSSSEIIKVFKTIRSYKTFSVQDQLRFLDMLDAIILGPIYDFCIESFVDIKWSNAVQKLEENQWLGKYDKLNKLIFKYVTNSTCSSLLNEHKIQKQKICEELNLPNTTLVFKTKLL